MSSTDPFIARQAKRTAAKVKCQLCPQITGLPKSKRDGFHDAMLNKKIELQTVVDVLADWGVSTNKTTLQKHRKGTCPLQAPPVTPEDPALVTP